VLKKVQPAVTESVRAHELALIQEVREAGRWTVPTVLLDLQMGRLHLLVVPWRTESVVWRCASGPVAADTETVQAFCPGQEVKQVQLQDLLPDLAAAHGARLEFVQGEAEAMLLQEFGGLAGLARW
jgi:peptide subunit release factor 1 (eRF1)